MLETFVCDACKKSFISAWSDEDAKKEMKENFGDIPEEDCSYLCEDCYEMFMEFYSTLSDADNNIVQ